MSSPEPELAGVLDRGPEMYESLDTEGLSEKLDDVEARQSEFTIARIAFDGCCRTGKGEQLGRLHSYFSSRGVPTMVLKGDGTRVGAGEAWHDLGSRYWTMRHDLCGGIAPPLRIWDDASYDLARENGIWLNALRQIQRVSESRLAVALYDRSIISRATLALERENLPEGERLTPEQMYPPNVQHAEPVNYFDQTPDILFNMVAPQEALIPRISEDDYDRQFRIRAVEDYYKYFVRAADSLPEGTETEIIEIEGLGDLVDITSTVMSHLRLRYPMVAALEHVKPMYEQHTAVETT